MKFTITFITLCFISCRCFSQPWNIPFEPAIHSHIFFPDPTLIKGNHVQTAMMYRDSLPYMLLEFDRDGYLLHVVQLDDEPVLNLHIAYDSNHTIIEERLMDLHDSTKISSQINYDIIYSNDKPVKITPRDSSYTITMHYDEKGNLLSKYLFRNDYADKYIRCRLFGCGNEQLSLPGELCYLQQYEYDKHDRLRKIKLISFVSTEIEKKPEKEFIFKYKSDGTEITASDNSYRYFYGWQNDIQLRRHYGISEIYFYYYGQLYPPELQTILRINAEEKDTSLIAFRVLKNY